jgi:hypothetical protein
VTLELFRQFKVRNHFHQVTASEAAMLMGLGTVLASLREGNYEQLLTEPPATPDSMMAALRENGRLRSLRVWQSVQSALAGKAPPPRSTTSRVPSSTRAAQIAVGEGGTATAIALPATLLAAPQKKSGPVAPVEKISQHAIETVQVLLKMERWMEVRRLHRRLEELGCHCSIESLRYSLRLAPLAEFAMLHPLDPSDAGHTPQIVLWHEPLH